jgi:hypothetical protein
MEVDVSISILKVTNLPPSLENKSIFVYLQNSKDHIQGTTVKDGEVDFEKNGTPCFLIRKLLNESNKNSICNINKYRLIFKRFHQN